MRKAEYYLKSEIATMYLTPLQFDGIIRAIKKAQEETFSEAVELDNPWPLRDVLKKLKFATEYLLHEKNYDGQQYEELNVCVKRAGEIIAKLESLHT